MRRAIASAVARAAAVTVTGAMASSAACERPRSPKTAPVHFRKDTTIEACTTLPFSTVLDPIPNANTKNGLLCGTAVRCMLGMCWLEMTRAYAFGLYVDSSVLRMLAMRKYEWTPGGDLGKDLTALTTASGQPAPTLFLLDNKTRQPRVWGELTIALRMAQDIDGPHMADGFKRSVTKQLHLLQADASSALAGGPARAGMDKRLARALDMDASKDLPEVELLARAFLDLKSMKKGDLITFTWRQDSTLVMTAGGAALPKVVLRRPAVIRALFDVYCGSSAVSWEGSEGFRKSLGAMAEAVVEGVNVTDIVAPRV